MWPWRQLPELSGNHLSLKELGAPLVVSRAARDVHAKFLLRNGADEIVYPEKQLASWTAIRYSADHIFDYIELDGEYAILKSPFRTPGQDGYRKSGYPQKYNINIMALKRDGQLNMNISTETVLHPDETMLVLGDMKSIHKCFHI